MKVSTTCLFCESKFRTHQSEMRRGGGKYCCRRCALSDRQVDGGLNKKCGTMKHKGYILEWAPDHEANVKGYVPQHRLKMERHIGRLLRADELIHHKNHIKDDNRIENLEIVTATAHAIHHHSKVFVNLLGEKTYFTDAIRKIGLDRSSVKSMKKRKSFTHQEVIDFYIHKRGLLNEK